MMQNDNEIKNVDKWKNFKNQNIRLKFFFNSYFKLILKFKTIELFL